MTDSKCQTADGCPEYGCRACYPEDEYTVGTVQWGVWDGVRACMIRQGISRECAYAMSDALNRGHGPLVRPPGTRYWAWAYVDASDRARELRERVEIAAHAARRSGRGQQ